MTDYTIKSSEAWQGLLERIGNVTRRPRDTWETLSEDDQDHWRLFFYLYCVKTHDMGHKQAEEFAGKFAHIFTIGHEYHRFYGSLWGEK